MGDPAPLAERGGRRGLLRPQARPRQALNFLFRKRLENIYYPIFGQEPLGGGEIYPDPGWMGPGPTLTPPLPSRDVWHHLKRPNAAGASAAERDDPPVGGGGGGAVKEQWIPLDPHRRCSGSSWVIFAELLWYMLLFPSQML